MGILSRALPRAVLVVTAGVALAGCGSGSSTSTASVTQTVTASAAAAGPSEVSIKVPGEDRFTPFTALVAPNGTISVTNTDTDEHTMTNLPNAAVKFDIHVKANETKTLTLPAGVYRYFCTLHAKYVAATDQVAALSTAGFPDQPMQGVLIVG